MSSPRWKLFERLVAAIHRVQTAGAEVKWNDNINKRRFDVTIRFVNGLYNYLTVIECKDEKDAVSVDVIESFVTKSRDAHANKAIVISSAGFQSGSIAVAERHGISLFTLKEVESFPEDVLTDELVPALNIYDLEIERQDGTRRKFADDHRPEQYLITNCMIIQKGGTAPLSQAVESALRNLKNPLDGKERECQISMRGETKIAFPHEDVPTPTKALHFRAQVVSARTLKGPTLDLALLSKAYQYKDAITGGERIFQAADVPVEYPTIFNPATFYTQPSHGFFYYCESITGKLAKIQLVESYQNGMLIQAPFEQETQYAKYYLEVTDTAILNRLRKMLADVMKRRDTRNVL